MSLATMPEITAAVSPPRLVGIGYPSGCPLGAPGDADSQREVLRATLEAMAAMENPGTRVDLEIEYTGPRVRGHPPELPPIAKLLTRKPWLLPKLVTGRIPD